MVKWIITWEKQGCLKQTKTLVPQPASHKQIGLLQFRPKIPSRQGSFQSHCRLLSLSQVPTQVCETEPRTFITIAAASASKHLQEMILTSVSEKDSLVKATKRNI